MTNPGENMYPVLQNFQTYLKNCEERNVCMACERPLWINFEELRTENSDLKIEVQAAKAEAKDCSKKLKQLEAEIKRLQSET